MTYNVAVVGATGKVGQEILHILAERNFPINEVYALATQKSAGRLISFGGNDTVTVQALEGFDFTSTDIALFSPGSHISKIYVPKAVEQGTIVVDNTSYFRMDPEVPLIIPEVNIECLKDYQQKKIIANPNCSTIQMLVALKPLHDLAKIKRIVVATYQSVSGAGKEAMDELFYQTKSKFVNQEYKNEVFEKQIAFNCIPHIDELMSDGHTREEWKMEAETKKILDHNIEVCATCVRVPVFVGHGEAVNVEFEQEIELDQAREALENAPGIILTEGNITPLDSVKEDAVYVSRFRQNKDKSLSMWIVADNLRKGAALNAIQIAEHLINT